MSWPRNLNREAALAAILLSFMEAELLYLLDIFGVFGNLAQLSLPHAPSATR